MGAATVADLRSPRFLRALTKESLAALGAIAAVLGLVGLLFPDALKDRGALWIIAVVLISVGYGVWRAWPRPIECRYAKPNTMIRLIKGDIFEEDGHIVVGTCDTFDTQVPKVISPKSVQGQALQRIYNGDLARLNDAIAEGLRGASPVARVEKEGNTDRYPVGTVASVEDGPRRVFFLAYTEMNERNEAQGTSDGIWKSMLSLWDAISRDCNGEAVTIPVLGGGQARISQVLPAQDSIRFIALSFMLASRSKKVCDELRIIVQPEDYARLNRLELQAFFDSLEMS